MRWCRGLGSLGYSRGDITDLTLDVYYYLNMSTPKESTSLEGSSPLAAGDQRTLKGRTKPYSNNLERAGDVNN